MITTEHIPKFLLVFKFLLVLTHYFGLNSTKFI
uniref:Uncharacterized protein n=1 Tax=Brugia timori TaxID=42155 RepID=A0A0R3Q3R5_9BILA